MTTWVAVHISGGLVDTPVKVFTLCVCVCMCARAGDPVLSHLERHTAEFALRLHAGADECEHVRALLHTVCVAGGG